ASPPPPGGGGREHGRSFMALQNAPFWYADGDRRKAMLPYKDNIPSRRVPFITWALIGINVIVFIFELMEGSNIEQVFYQFGMVPAYVTAGIYGPRYEVLPFLTSMFMHAGWLHIGGNMLYLWIFGDNVEDRMGHVVFLLFYLLSGVGASLLHLATDPGSAVPTVGASGAIAGVMGAYLVLYPKARIRTVVFFFYLIRIMEIPALVLLGFWFVLQFFSGVVASVGTAESGGVAFWAHVGGFIVGIAGGFLAKLLTKDRSMEVISPDGRSVWR
ncbi:MAG: rhomboid family intramembrane serine protease, partial [Deltaproteobacteria bacterium]|nr:rhomboid family intramembrane serine protease [Candidatus Zymogenaceae bacterium]